jgi:hypothetical protein
MGYSIIKRADHEFVLRSEEQDILKCASRREAARIIARANDLMRIAENVDSHDVRLDTEQLKSSERTEIPAQSSSNA